ncbi:MAG: TIGR03790 family protein [Verrucomicrobiae bacterium]|nr:TIGR03790 family protein [Verrucomicrobiae bacterium]
MMKLNKLIVFLAAASLALPATRLAANSLDTGASVVVVYNTREKDSEGVARHYAARRIVPKQNLIGLALPPTEEITRAEFITLLQRPLLAEMEKRKLFTFEDGRVTDSQIRYLTLCYGVPLKIKRDVGLIEQNTDQLPEPLRKKNEASVDSELSWLPRSKGHVPLNGAIANVFYGTSNLFNFHSTNGVLMVGRLDGPTPVLAKRLVDFAISAETNGFWGNAYIDLRGITEGEYARGDSWLRAAATAAKSYGMDTIIDEREATFPTGFPLGHAGFYAGWYSEFVTGPFAEKTAEFTTGAVAYHLHSFSANTVRDENRNWVGPLVAQGATAVLGSVYEPFLAGTPDIGVFADRLLNHGYSLGEAAYAAERSISWMSTVVGDPMYRPCGRHPRLLHEDLTARGRTADLEWSNLRVVNLNLMKGTAPTNMINYLAAVPGVRESSLMLEKIGDLYDLSSQDENAARAWAMALQQRQSTQQHKRLILKTADRLVKLGRKDEAKKLYQLFLQKFPTHPDAKAVAAKADKL